MASAPPAGSKPRQLHLNINILHAGFYASAWRMPQTRPRDFLDIDHYVRTARVAERGKFDAVFLADRPALESGFDARPFLSLEPTVVLSTIAAHTTHIGLIATASTSFNEPYNIARRFATVDIASRGRAGLNVVTTSDPSAAANFGQTQQAHADRYQRAQEFTEVVRKLWRSWDDDAWVGDKAGARLIDGSKVHPIEHQGDFFSVRGALNVPRSPQGQPVLVQAGGSGAGRDLAARHAEVVFSVGENIEQSAAYAADLRARAVAYGRRPHELVVLPGLATVIGSTEAEARRREQELAELIPIDFAVQRVSQTFGTDLSGLDLDAPFPDVPIPAQGGTTFAQSTLNFAREGNLTFRQLLYKLGGGIGHRVIVGTPEQIADDIQRWFEAGAADGFNLMPDVLPDGLEAFVDEVVPILQRRGIFRTEYSETTLRGHLGLA